MISRLCSQVGYLVHGFLYNNETCIQITHAIIRGPLSNRGMLLLRDIVASHVMPSTVASHVACTLPMQQGCTLRKLLLIIKLNKNLQVP
jgi:hypothetical protein